jgi:hypothetical protein
MKWTGNTLNKGYLVRKLRERGLSRRRSVQLLNFILDEVAVALARGEDVEFPFGSLKRVPHPHKKKEGWFLGRMTTIYKKPNTVALEVDVESEKLVNKKKGSCTVAASAHSECGLHRSSTTSLARPTLAALDAGGTWGLPNGA